MKFNDYYLGYLSKHRKLGTRMFHYIGIFMTFLFIIGVLEQIILFICH